MKSYKNNVPEGLSAAFELDGEKFFEAELTSEEESIVINGRLHEQYYVLYEWERECHADNDGGIDSFDFGETELRLAPENSILRNGAVIGFFLKKCIFLFDNKVRYPGGGCRENVGGWGDISSDSRYTLMKR